MPGPNDPNDQSYAKRGWQFVDGQWFPPDFEGGGFGGQKADRDRNQGGRPTNSGVASDRRPGGSGTDWGGYNPPQSNYHGARAPAPGPVKTSLPPLASNAQPNVKPKTSYEDQARALQQSMIDQLHGIENGTVQTGAQKLLAQQYQNARNAQASTGANVRNQGAGSVAQQTALGQQDLNAGQVGDTQIARITESNRAREMISQLYGSMNGQDSDLAGQLASIQNANNLLTGKEDMSLFGDNLRRVLNQNTIARDRASTNLGLDLDKQAVGAEANRKLAEGGAASLEMLLKMYDDGDEEKHGTAPLGVAGNDKSAIDAAYG